MSNKYVDFVSDEDFLECVQRVILQYRSVSLKVDMARLQRNVVDPFKMVFDIMSTKIGVDDWIKGETIRQDDKTINNYVGEFHQMLLGKVKGWEDLGTGDPQRVDLRRSDNSIFIEIKNKHNTMNDSGIEQVRLNLERAVLQFPKAVAYWAYIVAGSSGEEVWIYKPRVKAKRKVNPRIKVAWGKKVYQLVTGDPFSLEKTWEALPQAIIDLSKKNSGQANLSQLNTADRQKLLGFFESAFGR